MTTTSTEFDQSLFHISDPSESYLSSANKNNLEKLINGIKERKKLFLVAGEDGSGKTVLVQRAVCELGTKTRLLSVNRGDFSYKEFIEYIGKDLETGFSSEASLQTKKLRIKELLQMWSIQHVVIHIDQSVNYQQEMLEDIFKLVDDKICDSCFFCLIMTGLPGLANTLKKSGLPGSDFSDACSIQVDPLTSDEVIAYVNFHLQDLNDRGKNLFSDDALKHIVRYSKGSPRLINRLCSLGLLTAKLEEKTTVTQGMIEEVLENSLLLGYECGYVTSSIKEIESLSDEFAVENKEPFALNSLMKQEMSEQEAIEDIEPYKQNDSEESVQPIDAIKQSLSGSIQKVSDNISAIFSFSNKTVFISAFVMGIIFSTLVGAGLYFLQQANQQTPVRQVAIADASQFQAEKNLMLQKVAALLKRSKQQFAQQHLMTPEKDNAWETFQEILELVPDHPKALAGIAKIKETYVLWARQEIQRGNYQQAAYHYRKALEAVPDDQDILQAMRDVNQKQFSGKAGNAPVAKIALTGEEKERIQKLLFRAKQQLAGKKLMSPVEDSAWSTYKKILALDPGHRQAISGINKIKATYIRWAEHEIRKGNNKHAIFLFRKALEISPNDRKILAALANIPGMETHGIWDNNTLSGREFYKLLDNQKGIDELLNFAERQIVRKRLTKPPGDSAFTVYQVILNRFPTHEKALAGVKKIKEIYALWARHEVKQGNYPQAELLYGRALQVAPADPEIITALNQTKTLGRIKKKLNRFNQE